MKAVLAIWFRCTAIPKLRRRDLPLSPRRWWILIGIPPGEQTLFIAFRRARCRKADTKAEGEEITEPPLLSSSVSIHQSDMSLLCPLSDKAVRSPVCYPSRKSHSIEIWARRKDVLSSHHLLPQMVGKEGSSILMSMNKTQGWKTERQNVTGPSLVRHSGHHYP